MIDSSAYAFRPHPGRETVPLALTSAQRAHCEALLRAGSTEQRVARRAQAVLLLADGVTASDTARLLGVHERTVFKWRDRFAIADPTTRLADAPRPGRPPSLSRPRPARASSPRRAGRPPT